MTRAGKRQKEYSVALERKFYLNSAICSLRSSLSAFDIYIFFTVAKLSKIHLC